MNQYELGIVLRSTLTEEEVSQVIENVKSRIAELGGECTDSLMERGVSLIPLTNKLKEFTCF